MNKLTLINGCSKGEALIKLRPMFSKNGFSVPTLILISCDDWFADDKKCIETIKKEFGSKKLVVRSSASDEDGDGQARAGEYDSVLNVSADQIDELKSAMSLVIDSYSRKGSGSRGQQIIVQEMVERVIAGGVVFTRELTHGAPYYVVNYDDVSGSTSSVTSGNGEYANRTLYVHRSAIENIRSDRFNRLIRAVRDLENIIGSDFLDIEFAIDQDLQPHLLQVRPITTQSTWDRSMAELVDSELRGIQSFARERFKPQFGVFGKTTVLGQMPDWNPAEMIGRAPRALSFSLYRCLITDDAWRLARETMGYAVPSGQPLMVSLAGQPFIDTRLSFHSYLPASLSPAISCKLVDTWIERLRDQPELHDKVEFDVAITTFSFDLDERMDELAGCLDVDERGLFRQALLDLTHPLLQGQRESSIAPALARIDRLAARDLPHSSSGPMGLHTLIEECVRYGTVPFAILARHGFIARTLLLSLMRRGVLDEDTVARIQGGVRTVAGEFLEQIHALDRGELPRADFMQRYGHLRPGTYDILSPRYDQMETFGTGLMSPQMICNEFEPFHFSMQQRSAVDGLLHEAGLSGVDSEGLLAYVSEAIAGREYGKFVFTRSVSAMLELIAAYGGEYGLSREDLSHIPIDAILKFGKYSGDVRTIENRLRDIAEKNKERHALTAAIRLPQVLFDEAGVHVVPFQVSQPNFITSRKVTADIVLLGLHQHSLDLDGCIVLIENADPGYDWIFSQSIAGLVTKYGGANSHMAIRCAEFDIPAAIGCGEQSFESISKSKRIQLDCSANLINISL